jgi:flagellar basal-body rod protein FlgF
MDNTSYVALSRQTGLMRELNAIANNIANINTTGFRREGALFLEQIDKLDAEGEGVAVATTTSRHYIDLNEGEIKSTPNPLDFAIEGEGFFVIETPQGPRLTRAGSFSLNGNGEIVTIDGKRVLDESGGAIVVPLEAVNIAAAPDGSITADGQVVGKLGVVTAEPSMLIREGDNLFKAEEGYTPAAEARVRQNAIEGSNVSAVTEIAKLIEVQRTYEMGQKFLQTDDERVLRAVRQIGQTS